MIKFAENSNLPVDSETVLLGRRYKQWLDDALMEAGLKPVYVPDNPYVDARLSGHADLSVLHIGGNMLAAAPYLKNTQFSEEIKALGFELFYPDAVMKANYPLDAGLNICICGKYFFCNPKSADTSCVNILKTRGYEQISVNQGYTKCSVCVVDEASVITADRGIHSAAVSAGMDSLLINTGHIELGGYDYGFIGGSCFKLSKSKLAFTGRFDMHPDAESIIEFLKSRGTEPVFLTNGKIFDIGSILPLTEK